MKSGYVLSAINLVELFQGRQVSLTSLEFESQHSVLVTGNFEKGSAEEPFTFRMSRREVSQMLASNAPKMASIKSPKSSGFLVTDTSEFIKQLSTYSTVRLRSADFKGNELVWLLRGDHGTTNTSFIYAVTTKQLAAYLLPPQEANVPSEVPVAKKVKPEVPDSVKESPADLFGMTAVPDKVPAEVPKTPSFVPPKEAVTSQRSRLGSTDHRARDLLVKFESLHEDPCKGKKKLTDAEQSRRQQSKDDVAIAKSYLLAGDVHTVKMWIDHLKRK